MKKVFIPYQEDLTGGMTLHEKYDPIMLNKRFIDYINTHPDMIGITGTYNNQYLNYLNETNEDIAVLIPGGMDIGDFPARDNFECALIEICIKRDIPLLGICKGLQVLNHYFGGTLKQIPDHWAADDIAPSKPIHKVVQNSNSPFIEILGKELEVNSYHRWAVDTTGENIEVLATDPVDNTIEMIRVSNKPLFGIQWHPDFCHYDEVSQKLLELLYKNFNTDKTTDE